MDRTNRAYRWRERMALRGIRMLFPPIRRAAIAEEATSPFTAESADGVPAHLHVIDQGSDTTIVSFSSVALLHAGQPTREFEALFRRNNVTHNLVFLRDVHRACYHLTPTGAAGGLDYHENELKSVLSRLGAKRVVAIGDSGGAAAAIYYGTRLGFDRVVAFNPPFPIRHWISPTAQLHAHFNLRRFVRERSVYWEHVVNAVVPIFGMWLRLGLRVGFDGIWDPVATYLAASDPPDLQVFYSERSRPERKIVDPLSRHPKVQLMPLPTASHFGMAALARRGDLETTILRGIGAAS